MLGYLEKKKLSKSMLMCYNLKMKVSQKNLINSVKLMNRLDINSTEEARSMILETKMKGKYKRVSIELKKSDHDHLQEDPQTRNIDSLLLLILFCNV